MCLVKTAAKPTEHVLRVAIMTEKGFIFKERYYNCEYDLDRAYRQFKKLNSKIIPLAPRVL